jgi:glycosyltransferase involved in cell wall biosynthesis
MNAKPGNDDCKTITVGLPVYNGEATIVRAISSVQGQSWTGPLEILVVDDGSTDGSREIVEQLAEADPRIRLIVHGTNRGRPCARNTILENATGAYLAWLDADDEWYPDKLSLQMRSLASAKGRLGEDVIAMCSFHWKWHDQPERLVRPHITGDNLRDFLSGDLGAYLWSMLGPTSAFVRTGKFDGSLPRLQDLDFMIRYAERGGKVISADTDVPLCIYNKTDDSRSGRVVEQSLNLIWTKHRATFDRYGQRFALKCRRRHYKLIARHNFANKERMQGSYFKIMAAAAKLRLLFLPHMPQSPYGGAAYVALAIKRLAGRCGGAERVVVDVANGLASRGVNVEIWHHERRRGAPFFELEPAVRIINTYSRGPRLTRTFGRLLAVLGPLRYAFPISALTWLFEHTGDISRFRKTLFRRKPTAVVAFQPSSFTDFLLASSGTEIPVIASLHNVPKEEFENPERWDPNPFDRYLRKRVLGRAAAITVLMDEFRDAMPAPLKSKVHVVPNMIHGAPPLFEGTIEKEPLILAVGRLVSAKDHRTLIEAVKLFPPKFDTWSVEIIGEGPLYAHVKSAVDALGLADRIALRPSVRDIHREYARASIFCIPSRFEGFGLVTAEALQAGLPAVGFADCPGTNRLIKHEVNGLLAEGEPRAAALAAALCKLMESPGLRAAYSEAAPGSVKAFSPSAVVDRWMQLLEGVIAEAARPQDIAHPAKRSAPV